MTTESNLAKTVPSFNRPFGELIEKDPLFDSSADALEWANEHGLTVLKEQAMEVVQNLLGAASEERRTRGVLILTRAVLAQVGWLEFFQTWSANGRFRQLKASTDAIRDADGSVEYHQQACKRLLEEHQALLENIQQDKARREAALATIGDLLREKPFMASVEERQLLVDRRPKAQDQDWAVKALDLVASGNPEAVRTPALVALAGNLEFHAARFFGEGSKPNLKNGPTRTVRNGRPAAKRAADRAATSQLKVAGGKSKK